MPHNIRTYLGQQIDRLRKLFLQSQGLPIEDFFFRRQYRCNCCPYPRDQKHRVHALGDI